MISRRWTSRTKQVLDLEHGLADGCDSPRSTVSSTAAADHQLGESSSSVADGRRLPTTRPRRITVIRSAIASTS